MDKLARIIAVLVMLGIAGLFFLVVDGIVGMVMLALSLRNGGMP